MGSIVRLTWIILLIVIGALLFRKGLQLWDSIATIDGDGIGVSFLGLEVSDSVKYEDIRYYAGGFITGGIASFILALTQWGRAYSGYYR
ncbi:hypothetical protein A8F94_01350 [Bacillus sp. FJAT-27225]|uniref:hypothetical protein n=1 Tax=Bacillus sp. FJAT-27225 TaxID=1743144 RepID=UPI00080C3275|nr:hypothetical protein [Bacillus sp. FJAT-27225]OCA90557.1 hypothetical protein A8F94_01350 [Bacillus sp. FJAT-27225]